MGKTTHLLVAEQEELLYGRARIQRACSHNAATLCCVHALHALLSGTVTHTEDIPDALT